MTDAIDRTHASSAAQVTSRRLAARPMPHRMVNPIFQRADWMSEANCRGMDPEFFHPRRGQACEHIKAVCNDCPVIDPCRKMALEDHTLRGIWGGMSETQRRDYRQRRRARTARVSAAFQSLRGTA